MNIFYVMDFIKLAETGNYSAAADELYISQSSLSKHIQSLEKVLGVKLFNRNFHSISLTEGGNVFLPYAMQLQDTFLNINKDLKNLISDEHMSFTLGCMPTMSFYDIMDIVAAFKYKHPNKNIYLSEFPSTTEKDITEKLFNNDYEIVFTDSIFLKRSKIERINYCNDHLVAVLNRNHPLAESETIDLKKLANEPLAFLNKLTTTYLYSCKACEKAEFIPKIDFLGSRIENVLEYVLNNMGVALLMKNFTSMIQSDTLVVREIVPTVQRTICLGRTTNKIHSDASNLFWNFFLSYGKTHGFPSQKPRNVLK